MPTAEDLRLEQSRLRTANWQRWGPYLSERQWGTVREDYSQWGDCWTYFPHDHARSRAYRWGEDGLLGICDRECRLCFALTLWNGQDPILKERLFGLTGPEGNHGEDVKECYYYLDSSPTHSYLKALYKYPQAEFPYQQLLQENRSRGRNQPEFELADTGVFRDGRYFDVFAEYAKAAPDDILIRITAANRGPEPAVLHLLPTLWFRNTWSWGCTHEGCEIKPTLRREAEGVVIADHATLGRYRFFADPAPVDQASSLIRQAGSLTDDPGRGEFRGLLFTENETNSPRLLDRHNSSPRAKDAFHDYIVHGRTDGVCAKGLGTKTAAHYVLTIPPGGSVSVRLRLKESREAAGPSIGSEFGPTFEQTFDDRLRETDAFYNDHQHAALAPDQRAVARQASAGLLWSKQFYHFSVHDWLDGDPEQPPPPAERKRGRNADWRHLFNRDVISMPDKWEYPWYAAWDLAFHMIPFASLDPEFARQQLVLFLREWYMHPSGQMPAYEFAFSDVNPPVHAWACWRVYKIAAPRGQRDREFLARVFHKLLINFTWWVNRKDVAGKHLFSGGFLGLDNIGLFDRNKPLPTGGHLEQADGTAWMAFYCVTMLAMALELAEHDSAYEDVASKFFEHFVAIADAMNLLDGGGLWDETDGFYYDHVAVHGRTTPLKIRSMVGLLP